MATQFTKGNKFQVRTVALKDMGDRDQGGDIVYKAGEIRGTDPTTHYTGQVTAVAPYKGEWLCQLEDGRLARVHPNKIVGNEQMYIANPKRLEGKGQVATSGTQATPPPVALDPIKALQAHRANIARLEAELGTAKALLPKVAEAAKAHVEAQKAELAAADLALTEILLENEEPAFEQAAG